MAFDEGSQFDRIRSLEAQLSTLRQQTDRVTQKCADIRESLCARERSDGSFVINFEALVEKLGVESCLELRAAIDARYGISGAAGEKPRVRVKAEASA